MKSSLAVLAVFALSAFSVQGQSQSGPTQTINTAVAATISRPDGTINTGSTQIIISTNTQTTAHTSSASGTSTTAFSVPSVDVSSLPASISSSSVRTASSNFTLPKADATASLPANFVMQESNPFVFTEVETQNLPTISYSLLNETLKERQIVCDEQTRFCKTAGCVEADATIKDNFCNVDTMGVSCTCTKGSSNLQQWKWPVQFADCLRRGTTCTQACMLPGGTTAERTACREACNKNFGGTCGFPNQYSANYAVKKEGDKPKFAMIQGGTAGDGALSLRVALTSVVSAGALCVLTLLA